jgi:hypothetical protein
VPNQPGVVKLFTVPTAAEPINMLPFLLIDCPVRAAIAQVNVGATPTEGWLNVIGQLIVAAAFE